MRLSESFTIPAFVQRKDQRVDIRSHRKSARRQVPGVMWTGFARIVSIPNLIQHPRWIRLPFAYDRPPFALARKGPWRAVTCSAALGSHSRGAFRTAPSLSTGKRVNA